ncbi:MAG: prolyl oligopeptidase family serine peptidase [Hamadaea sp.]|nr:prolyl oligopeptidase family serine peptidase [Hamadaea sp.]
MDSLPEQLVRTRRFTLGVPDRFTVTSDGATVLFLRSQAGDDPGTCLWAHDASTGAERILADPAQLTGAAGSAVTAYDTDGAGHVVVFTLAGQLWVVRPEHGKPRRLPVAGPAAEPRVDPAGLRIAYRTDRELRVITVDGDGDRAVATPESDTISYGIAEHTSTTSVDGARGFWWSRAGDRLLVARTDHAEVELWHLPGGTDPARPPRSYRHAAAGKANADVTLWIIGLDGTRIAAGWDRRAFEYVVGGGWDAHGPFALVQSRDQRTVRLLGIDPATGATTVLHEDHDDHWVQLIPGLPTRTPSGALVTHLDRDGTRHLAVDGTPVTPAALHVRAVVSVDGEDILFTASHDPAETHLYRYRIGGMATQVSDAPGVHSGVQRMGTLVLVTRESDRPGGRVTVTRTGAPGTEIGWRAQQPVLAPRATRLVLGARRLRARLFLPSWHRADEPLPVLLDPYGGAGTQRVTADLAWHCHLSQWFAERGFAVLVADGAGTPGRGPAWEREVCGDLLGPVLDDQVTALQETAARHPWLDLARVGIRGHSFGAMLAVWAVLRRPDVFHAAAASSGVTDQRLYGAHWRERFLGHPAVHPERYDAFSLVAAAPSLTRPVQLVHGLADVNVHPAHTLLFSQALLAAGKPHEVVLLPDVGHQLFSSGAAVNLLYNQVRFLRQHV